METAVILFNVMVTLNSKIFIKVYIAIVSTFNTSYRSIKIHIYCSLFFLSQSTKAFDKIEILMTWGFICKTLLMYTLWLDVLRLCFHPRGYIISKSFWWSYFCKRLYKNIFYFEVGNESLQPSNKKGSF